MLKRNHITVLAILSLLPVAALADGTVTLTLSSPSNGQTLSAGDPISWSITAEVSTGDNIGLALIAVDLVQDSQNPELFDLPPADSPPAEMQGFASPGGITNPAGYGGTPVGQAGALNLAQIGGGQNIFGQPGPTGIGQDVDVETGIGQAPGGQVIATGSFSAPSTAGAYTFSLADAVANVLIAVQAPPLPSSVAAAEVVMANGSFTFTVGQGCPCLGDLSDPCDNIVNVSDFTIFAGAYGSQLGDPDYSPAADFNGDGFVNVADFTIFAGAYGSPCP
jgi:hypothetical protein